MLFAGSSVLFLYILDRKYHFLKMYLSSLFFYSYLSICFSFFFTLWTLQHNFFFVFLQAELPSAVGIVDEEVPFTDNENEAQAKTEKKYYIDTPYLKVPRKGMEVTSFLKDGMSK